PIRHRIAAFGWDLRRSVSRPERSLTPIRPSADQIGDSPDSTHPRLREASGNHEFTGKSKGPDVCPGLWQIGGFSGLKGRERGLLVLFGLLFRRRQAFEALEEFLLGHSLDRDLGIVG